ncbi:hypothetical protein AXE77_06205 [Gardnerella vaginalis]|uniref:Uncharacterized protein n=1 Tax=Gardnerella vaginalis TaxID=2702 RepID=A0A3E1J0Z4_GARVA|nr:hypothetical protein AXE77_06205 [Gardnerella vaginalis]
MSALKTVFLTILLAVLQVNTVKIYVFAEIFTFFCFLYENSLIRKSFTILWKIYEIIYEKWYFLANVADF